MRVGSAIAVRIVKRPSGILSRLVLLHGEAIRAGLGKLELTERERLGCALSNGPVGGNLELTVSQALDVLSLVLHHERQREGVVRCGIRTFNGLGHLNLRIGAAANHGRVGVVIVHEAELRGRIAIGIRVRRTVHDLAHGRTVRVLNRRHRGKGMHGAVAVVQHLNVNAVLGLVEVDALECLFGFVRTELVFELVNKERIGLAGVRLVEGQMLQLLHLFGNTRVQDPMGELEVLLMELGGVFLGLPLDGEEEGVVGLGAVVERLGHHDSASTLGAVVHGRLIGVVELSLVGHRTVCAVAVGHIGNQSALLVVRHVDRHGADVGIVGHARAVGGLGAVLISNLVHREGVPAHLGEGHLTEVEVSRTVGKARHLNRLGVRQHALSIGIRCLQLEVEGLAFLHVATSERLRAVDGVSARQGSIGRIVGVLEHEVLRVVIRSLHRRYDVGAVAVGYLLDADLNRMLSIAVGHTSLVSINFGHLVNIRVTRVVTVEGDRREGEILAHVGRSDRIVLCVVRHRGIRGSDRQIVGVAAIGHKATLSLKLEAELTTLIGVVSRGVVVNLLALNAFGIGTGVVGVLEGHRIALNRRALVLRIRQVAAVVVHKLDLHRVNDERPGSVVANHHGYTIDGIGVIDTGDGLLGVTILLDGVTILTRCIEGDVPEGCRVRVRAGINGYNGILGHGHRVNARRRAESGNCEVEGVGVAPIAALEVLLNLERGVGVEAHLIRMVCVAERERCLRAGRDRAGHNTVRSVGVLDTLLARCVRHRPAILANALLGHGKRRASGEPIDADRRVTFNGQRCRTVVERHLTGSGFRIAYVIIVRTSKGLGRILALFVYRRIVSISDIERKVVLLLFGLIGGITPIDILLDLKRSRHVKGKLAVVAQVLGYISSLPHGGKNITRRLRQVAICTLCHNERCRTIRTWSVLGNVNIPVRIFKIPFPTSSCNGTRNRNLLRNIAVTRVIR